MAVIQNCVCFVKSIYLHLPLLTLCFLFCSLVPAVFYCFSKLWKMSIDNNCNHLWVSVVIGLIFFLSFVEVTHSSLLRVDASWPFPTSTLACLLLLVMFRRPFWQHFMVITSDITRIHNHTANSCSSLTTLLHIFLNDPLNCVSTFDLGVETWTETDLKTSWLRTTRKYHTNFQRRKGTNSHTQDDACKP